MPQQYSNHRMVYPPHHFIFYPLGVALLGWCIYHLFHSPAHHWEWMAITTAVVCLLWLSFMMRQHYALGMQDRIIRLEMRFRYFTLTQQRFEPLEAQLRFGQIAALRFASDEELPALLKRTIEEKLSPKQIKQSIHNWLPDTMRV